MRYPQLRTVIAVLSMTGVLLISSLSAAAKAPSVSAVNLQALAIFERASSFLAKQNQYSVTAEVWEDFVFENGSKIQIANTVEMNLRRPDHFRSTVATTQPERAFYYDGKNITLLDPVAGFFGSVAAPPTIDKTLEVMEQNYNLTFPLDDLLLSSPFDSSAAKANSGQYFGIEMILGRQCHHLAFQHEHIDWQAWVEEGPVPVLRKIVITHRQDPGSPQYLALFNSWDFTTELPDYLFNPETPSYFRQISIIEALPGKTTPVSK